MAPRQELITIYDAEIAWPNFTGRADTMNAEGNRVFNIKIDAETAEQMRARGLHVRQLNSMDPEDEPMFSLKIKVSYRFRTPGIYLIAAGSKAMLGQDQVGMLDQIEFEKVDLSFSVAPWKHRATGQVGGHSAYLEEMFATMYLSPLAREYADIPDLAITGGTTLALEAVAHDDNVIEGEVEEMDPRY